ncbi:MAG TPA: nuclear transport factor 2 family protein [Candidatus Cybelea sp.]|nr:nuclear transport factor 2 family protein [Candidatus Cybelea sp.]
MSEQQNVQSIKDAYAAFERGDVAAILAMLTDDVKWEMPGPAEIPYAGLRKGHTGAGEFFRRLSEADEVQVFEPRRFLADGNLVVAFGRYEARVKATGKIAKSDWVHVFEFRDGKVSSWREFYDSAEYAQAYR